MPLEVKLLSSWHLWGYSSFKCVWSPFPSMAALRLTSAIFPGLCVGWIGEFQTYKTAAPKIEIRNSLKSFWNFHFRISGKAKIGSFSEMGVSTNNGTPKSSILIRVFHYKPSILGAHPYFWKHPNPHLGNSACKKLHRRWGPASRAADWLTIGSRTRRQSTTAFFGFSSVGTFI